MDEAKLREARLVVVTASRGDAYVDPVYAPVQDLEIVRSELNNSGVQYELRQLVRGNEPAEEVVAVA